MSYYGSRPPASCKECRRLKLKCDKKVPCSSCARRGCASICPNGQMVARGTRFILANTEELHQKIDTLISRVRSLESALEVSNSQHSAEPHPLLRGELRAMATSVVSTTSSSEQVSAEEELADSVYTLTIDGHGSRYFGPTGAIVSLWFDADRDDDPSDHMSKQNGDLSLALSGLPIEISHMADAFPIRIPTNEDTSHLGTWILENCLPSYEEAWSLFENFWEHYAWHSTPFMRTNFVEEILSTLYRRAPDPGNTPLGHRLGLLFTVFAIGQFMDFTHPPDVSSGQRYFMLARASLCVDPVFESPTITALQAMYLLGVYLMLSRGANIPEHAWILSGINTKLALTLGLHHDPDKFGLPPSEVEVRRRVMTSVLSFETWQSLALGRQPAYRFTDFEWLPPKAPDYTGHSPLLSSWFPYFVRDCLLVIIDSMKEAKYSNIMKVDAKIRDYPLPDFPMVSTDDASAPPGISLLMQHAVPGFVKEVSMLFLHRRFFALALARSPNDPLKSPFAPSVLACYRSSLAYLAKVKSVHAISPDMVHRLWFIWPNVFVATLILGSIVARSPKCSLAPSAFLELELVCRLWETTPDCVMGPKVLETVNKLKQKAVASFSQAKASEESSHESSGGIEVDDEIAALGGAGPHVISLRKPSRQQVNSPSRTNTSIHSGSESTSVSTPSPIPGATDPSLSYPVAHQPYDYTGVDPFAQFSEFATGSFGAEFDDVFQNMSTYADMTAQAPYVGPSVLDELGLREGWQPVMDDLGL